MHTITTERTSTKSPPWARRSLRAAAVALLAVGAVLPASASATSAYQQVLHVYEREGSIPPCQFTAAQLQTALSGVDTYGAQYFADFTQAVQAALTSRAGGACSVSAARGPATRIQASGPVAPPPAVALTASTSAGVPWPLAVLGGLAVAGSLLASALAVAQRRPRPRPATPDQATPDQAAPDQASPTGDP
jgi:hypothetical protein